KMTEISVSDKVLNFSIGDIQSPNNLGFELKISKTKIIGSDTVLFDRELLSSEVEISPTSVGSLAGVSIEKLGVKLSGGRFSLTSKIFAKFDGNLMNSSQFDSLSASRTLLYKVR